MAKMKIVIEIEKEAVRSFLMIDKLETAIQDFLNEYGIYSEDYEIKRIDG